MSRNKTAEPPRQDQTLVTAAEWFAGGQRIWYDPDSARVLTAEQAAAAPGALRVFERVATSGHGADAVWLTMLPGFPDGSYGWAQLDAMLGDDLGPRLYAEPVGQGDSDKPRDYRYSTVERADLVAALWPHHGVRARPAAQALIVTRPGHRAGPAITLGLRPGEAPVIRNTGGRDTQAVIDDIAYLAYLAGQPFGGQDADDRLFEVAVIHHTQCGTGLLADSSFRHQAAEATRLPEGDPQECPRTGRTPSAMRSKPMILAALLLAAFLVNLDPRRHAAACHT